MGCRVRLEYLQDTFLGPIAKSVECEATIIPITPGAFQVQVQSPFPTDLHKAHTVTVIQPSKQPLTDTLVHTRKLANGDLELQIDVQVSALQAGRLFTPNATWKDLPWISSFSALQRESLLALVM